MNQKDVMDGAVWFCIDSEVIGNNILKLREIQLDVLDDHVV